MKTRGLDGLGGGRAGNERSVRRIAGGTVKSPGDLVQRGLLVRDHYKLLLSKSKSSKFIHQDWIVRFGGPPLLLAVGREALSGGGVAPNFPMAS